MILRQTLFSLALVSLAGPALAADPAAGKELVDESCYSCHGNEVYTRSDRRVTSLSSLQAQVTRCEQSLGLHWFPEQVEDASAHLDNAFYHFK